MKQSTRNALKEFYQKGALKNFTKSQKIPLLDSLFNKSGYLHYYNIIRKRLQDKRFLVNFLKFFRNAFFVEYLLMVASKNPMLESFFNKNANLTAWGSGTLLRRTNLFSVNFAKFLEEIFCRELTSNHF